MPNVRSASFVGAVDVWLATSKGELLFRAEQGGTWDRISADAVGGFKAVSFIDRQQGWAINERGQVWSSDDGGYKWGLIANLPEGAEQLNFIDRLHGWVIEPFSLWFTGDGGVTWERNFPLANPDGIEEPTHSWYFLNNRLGWLGGERGAIYSTNDGGKNWRGKRVLPKNVDVSAIFFIDEGVGWFCSRPNSSVYHTDDGGITWREQKLPSRKLDLLSIHFADQNHGFAVGSNRDLVSTNDHSSRGVILRTSDGGLTWELGETPPGELLYERVYFSDSQNGWLIDRDNVYETNDGGVTWGRALRLSH